MFREYASVILFAFLMNLACVYLWADDFVTKGDLAVSLISKANSANNTVVALLLSFENKSNRAIEICQSDISVNRLKIFNKETSQWLMNGSTSTEPEEVYASVRKRNIFCKWVYLPPEMQMPLEKYESGEYSFDCDVRTRVTSESKAKALTFFDIKSEKRVLKSIAFSEEAKKDYKKTPCPLSLFVVPEHIKDVEKNKEKNEETDEKSESQHTEKNEKRIESFTLYFINTTDKPIVVHKDTFIVRRQHLKIVNGGNGRATRRSMLGCGVLKDNTDPYITLEPNTGYQRQVTSLMDEGVPLERYLAGNVLYAFLVLLKWDPDYQEKDSVPEHDIWLTITADNMNLNAKHTNE